MATLTIDGIIKNGIDKGVKNLVPLFVNVLLFGLTFWIPYLNVGTFIGLTVGVVSKISRDEELSMTEIFDPNYRKQMGDFFLAVGLKRAGIMIASMFMLIPGMVLSISWSLVELLVVDKGLNSSEAITKSNELTYGKKWVIFLGSLLTNAGLFLAIFIVVWILGKIPGIGGLLSGLAFLGGFALLMSVAISVKAYIYGQLS